MGKLLLILLLLVLVAWWIARLRAPRPPRRRGAAPRPQEIVACAHCGLHLPRADAVAGPGGLYCSEAHRLADDGRG